MPFCYAIISNYAFSIANFGLNINDKTKIMGIHFTGVGFAIVSTDVIVKFVNTDANLWQTSWIILSLFAFVLFVYPWRVLTYDKSKKSKKFHFDKTLFTAFAKILIVAYFCEGVGFVVQATFLPDIINNLQGLKGYGGLTWLFVGIAGIPSSIIWMRLAHKYTSINMIILAMLLQIIGILIPTFTQNVIFNLISGAIYGSTFIGLTALFMNLGGKLSGENPVVLMGAITSAYSLGMIVAPLYSVAFFEKYKSYDYSLYLTAGVVMFGVLLLIYGKKFSIKENVCQS